MIEKVVWLWWRNEFFLEGEKRVKVREKRNERREMRKVKGKREKEGEEWRKGRRE